MQRIENATLDAIEKFVNDNDGECVAYAAGSLLDNAVYAFSFGTLFCFETYLNEWSSACSVLFYHKDRERGIGKAWDRFNALEDAACC